MKARAAVLTVVSCGLGGLAAADTWVEVKTSSFTVVSNAGEGTARRTANEFEQVRAAYAKLWPWARLERGKPTVVLALKNEGTLRKWAPGYFETRGGIDVVSGWREGADRVYLLLRTDYRPASMFVTPNYNSYRAYLELVLAHSFERRLPLWLSNGLSDVLGNTSVHDKEVLIGRPVPWQFQRFNEGGRRSLRAVLDTRADSPLVNKEVERPLFDAQCYVLVHYLLFADRGAHASMLTRFQQLWIEGRSQDQALAEAFGDLGALEGRLPGYAESKVLGFAQLPTEVKIEANASALRVLPPAEVAGLQASVHVAFGRTVEAQAAIREARTADPRAPASYDAEGLLADRDRDKPRATQAYAQAVELGSKDAYSYYRAAQLAWKAQPSEAELQAVRRRLERAIELNASFADAHSYLAEILAQLGNAEAALAPAERAIALEPSESYHRLTLARVLAKLNRDAEARQSAELGLQLADGDAERSDAERVLLFLKEKAGYEDSACRAGDAAACARILPGLEQRCQASQAAACLYLSWLYRQGAGVARDLPKAADYAGRACAAGDRHSCVDQAWALARGEGVARDEAKAIGILEPLCDAGFFPACTRLGYIHVARPTAAARARAKALFTRACAGGEQEACEASRHLK